MSFKNILLKKIRVTHTLIVENKEEIRLQNYKVLSYLSFITGIIMVCAAIVNVGIFHYFNLLPVYGLSFAVSALILACYKIKVVKQHPAVFLYLLTFCYIIQTIYMSIYYNPQFRATIAIGLFCVIPMLFIDEPLRMDLFDIVMCIIHTALSFAFKKSDIAAADALNCFSFTILGIFIGNIAMYSRLAEIDLRRRTEIDKVTDVLTGISNRRSLFEKIERLEKNETSKPYGAIMFDVDKFKIFNDTYGHAAGDECLHQIGIMLQDLQKERNSDPQNSYTGTVKFYRYGGDEFAAFVYGFDEYELIKFCDFLQKRAADICVNEQHVSISVGASFCGDQEIRNYEKLIESADKKLYEAKKHGRNLVSVGEYSAE